MWWREAAKRAAKAGVRALGYDVTRVAPDESERLYAGFAREVLERRLFFNFGAGTFRHRYWTNIDYPSEGYAEVQSAPFIAYDATTLAPLPLPTGAAEAFYCSYAIEHLPRDAVENVVREASRCLRPGGFLRIVTPDAELEYRAYRRGDREFFKSCFWATDNLLAGVSLDRVFLNHVASEICQIRPAPDAPPQVTNAEIVETFATMPMDAALDHFTSRCHYDPKRPGAHMMWWSDRKLIALVEAAGFSAVYRSGCGQSLCPPMREHPHFDPIDRRGYSLYIEAIK